MKFDYDREILRHMKREKRMHLARTKQNDWQSEWDLHEYSGIIPPQRGTKEKEQWQREQ